MSSSFGAATDHWVFVETGINLITSEQSKAGSIADCLDSNGTIVEQKVYDTGLGYEAAYEVCAGKTPTFYDTTTAKDFRIGKVISSKVITGIKVERSATARLKITISGENCPSADSAVHKFTPSLPAGYLAGGKGGIAAGLTVSKGKVISSSISVSAEVAKGLDSQGAQVCKAVYGAKEEATNELQSCDTTPAATAAAGWTLSPSGGGPKESNTGYPTTTFNAHRALTKDT